MDVSDGGGPRQKKRRWGGIQASLACPLPYVLMILIHRRVVNTINPIVSSYQSYTGPTKR